MSVKKKKKYYYLFNVFKITYNLNTYVNSINSDTYLKIEIN